MQSFHPIGHPNAKEKKRRIAELYYWPKLKTEVESFVKSCHPCQSTIPGKIQPEVGKFPIPDKRFTHLHLDVVGPLPKSRVFLYILSVYDRSSRHYECIPMVEATAEACCHAFLHGWVQRYGLPQTAIADNGNSFIAKLWTDLQKTLNIQVTFVPYYHQATNKAVESWQNAKPATLRVDFKAGFFFRPRQKNSRTKKLKTQAKNSKLKQKTQGFGKFWCNLLRKCTEITKKTRGNN